MINILVPGYGAIDMSWDEYIDHALIEKWRFSNSCEVTKERRIDLWHKHLIKELNKGNI